MELKNFKIVKTPSQIGWNNLLLVMNVMGLWHYSETYPNESDYIITPVESEDGSFIVTSENCLRRFCFQDSWQCSYEYLNPDLTPRFNDKPTEGQIWSALAFVDLLLEIGAIEYVNKGEVVVKPYFECERCEINSQTKGRVIPCPRGGCEAKETGTIIKTKSIVKDN